jgi:cell division protein FtsI (penicillin-binding protein 3)
MKAADVRRSARRVEVARVLLLCAFGGLALRAAQLSVFDQRAKGHGEAQTLRTLTLPPERGRIFDRAGAALALSIDAPSAYVAPSLIVDAHEAARRIAPIFGLRESELRRRLETRKGFQFLARWIDERRASRVEALSLRGVGIVQEPRRVYPHKTLAASIVGFANIDAQGVRGVEQQEDAWLRGTQRRLPVERDGSGRLLLVSGGATWGTAGGDVSLTLDAAMQADAERALADALAATGARGGTVVSLDPRSGEIYSLAEAPSFDPNRFRDLDYDSTRSAAFLDAVEPGSAFKPFLVAAALEQGAIRPDELIDCGDGTFRVPGKTIRDAHPQGLLDPAGVLRVSSNVGAVKIAQALGPGSYFDMLQRFGFGSTTGSRFPDESAGVLRSWRGWKPVDHATISFGQGVSVTAIQLAAAGATLANGGEWVRPRVVAARRGAGGPWQPTARDSVRRVLRRQTAERVVRMLETVVGPGGTGVRARLPGVRVAGKTGTAQKWDARAGRYSVQRFRAWFLGIVPADAPRLVIVASLDEPRRPLHTGGASAAPLFARVAEAHLARFGIFPEPAAELPTTRLVSSEPPAPNRVARAVAPAPAPVSSPPPRPRVSRPEPESPAPRFVSFRGRVLLPDFSGLGRRDVTRITDQSGIRVRFRGEGRATHQSPPPGTVMPAGGTVFIELSEAPSGGRAARPAHADGGST